MSTGPAAHLHEHPNERPSSVEWIALTLAALLLVVMRIHAFGLPLEADECNYAYIGAHLLQGQRLYIDLWDHQPFGIFAIFAAIIAIFGDAPVVFRWSATFFSLLTLGLVYLIARRIGGKTAAILAAVLFALVSADPGTAGEGCNREIFMNAFVLGAWFLALRDDGWGGWPALMAGLLLGLGSTIKTILAVHWLFLVIWLVWCARRKNSGVRVSSSLPQADMATSPENDAARSDTPRSVQAGGPIRSILVKAIGPLVVWVGAAAYFAGTGRFSAFIEAVFLANLGYTESGENFFLRFIRFFDPPRFEAVFDSALGLWIGGTIALFGLALWRANPRRRAALSLVALVLAGYLAVCLPGRFWPHYFYLLIPPLVITLAVGVVALVRALRDYLSNGAPLAARWIPVLYLFPCLTLFVTEYDHYLSQPPFGITVDRYNSRDFWARGQAAHVASVTEPEDSIFVYGNDPGIYYYSGRRCASRFTMITGLLLGDEGAARRREQLMADLKADPPRLILVVEKMIDPLQRYLEAYYGPPIGADLHDRSDRPIMYVYMRRDDPVREIDWDWDRSEVGGWFPGESEKRE